MHPPTDPARVATASPEAPEPVHLPVPEGEGCLEILSDRLRMSPGVIAIEADFKDHTVTVRYQPAHVSTEQLNELADDVGALLAQRVTYCERRQTLGSCEECALRLGRVPDDAGGEIRAIVQKDRVGVTRRDVPIDSAELKRPLSQTKPWGAKFTPAEQEHFAKGRAMAMLTGVCLVFLIVGMVLERATPQPVWHHLAFAISAIAGGLFTLRSTISSLARLRFDVNLLSSYYQAKSGLAGLGA